VSSFDAVAELYDRARPAYPPELIDEVAALGRRILARAGFDAVVAFTSFHWLDPHVRYTIRRACCDRAVRLCFARTHRTSPAIPRRPSDCSSASTLESTRDPARA